MSKETLAIKIKNVELLLEVLKKRGATKADIESFEMLLAKYKLNEAFLNGIKEEES